MIVYTAIMGNSTDALKEPARRALAPGVRFVCYTDQPVGGYGSAWDARLWSSQPDGDGALASRWIKMRPHVLFPGEPTLWVDASYAITGDVRDVPRFGGGAHVMALGHYARRSVADEGIELVREGKIEQAALERQMAEFAAQGYAPTAPELMCGGFIYRDGSANAARFGESWWDAYLWGGHGRDQMSMGYAAWRCGVRIGKLPGNPMANQWAWWVRGPGRERDWRRKTEAAATAGGAR